MKKFASCAVALLAVILFVAPAYAVNETEHVIQAPNGKGDVLIYPHYLALAGGWQTKLVVVNTNTARSVVAKVIIRSAVFSQELRDFLIYLSPADVWTGVLYNDAVEGAVIESADDSVVASDGPTFATPEAPMKIALVDNACDTNEIGYITVIETWSSDESWDCMGSGAVDLGPIGDTKVDKLCIYNSYHNVTGTGAADQTWLATNDGPWNCLAGHYELSLTNAFSATDNATVLRDYDQNTYTNAGLVTTLGTGAYNNLCEVEAALSKSPVDMYYYAPGSTDAKIVVNWVTFPTKLSVINTSCDYTSPYVRGPFVAWQASPYEVIYTPKYWDLSENTPGGTETHFSPYTPTPDETFPAEVNFKFTQPDFVAATYTEGWIRYAFEYTTTCDPSGDATNDDLMYTGAPAIAFSWVFGGDGAGLGLLPAAFTNGAVSYETTIGGGFVLIPYYQYRNGAYDAAPLGEFYELNPTTP
jgi:hypothetical protein